MLTHTIAAVSTPHGKGGVAMIRISGDGTRAIIERVFVPRGQTPPAAAPRRAVFGLIRDSGQALCDSGQGERDPGRTADDAGKLPHDGEQASFPDSADLATKSDRTDRDGGQIIDSGMCTFFAAPASYTGEDTAEITCHGGIAVTARVLGAVLRAGAELAGPGEFTRRAFINGKLTLSEADAVGLLIDADTDARAELAANAASGVLSAEIRRIADSITEPLSALYAAIDYPDEDLGEIEPAQIAEKLEKSCAGLDALAATYRRGSAIVDGVPSAIVGAPNAGKSSLYNAVCGSDAAIVTDIAGTTRDVLTQTVSFGGVTLLMRDTAGLRQSGDTVEQIGVERAKSTAGESALVLFVYDLSRALTQEERDFAGDFVRQHPDCVTVAVFNKCDLGRALSESDEAFLRSLHRDAVTLSAQKGLGIDALAKTVAGLYGTLEDHSGDAVIWSAAQLAAISRSHDLLCECVSALRSGDMPDAACTMAESALESLMQIDGRGVSEEIVNTIFSRFCVGK